MTSVLLQLEHVTKVFGEGAAQVRAVEDVCLDLRQGECLAIVGESGSGKSTIANMILGLCPPSSGRLLFQGAVLPVRRTLAHRQMIQLVQQPPLSALNPKRTIGQSLRLALDVHKIGEKKGRALKVAELLEEVGLPADTVRRFPAALSGGQRQRVAIARALACETRVVVLDEPTSALDVLVQARVLRLLGQLQKQRGLSFIFITHDLSVVRNIADRIAVFKRGRLVETGDCEMIFSRPETAYTRTLIAAVPVLSPSEIALRRKILSMKGEEEI